MKQLNAHQDMIRSMKTFVATASDEQLKEKTVILTGLISSADNDLSKAAVICLRIIEREIADRG